MESEFCVSPQVIPIIVFCLIWESKLYYSCFLLEQCLFLAFDYTLRKKEIPIYLVLVYSSKISIIPSV